MKGIEEPLAIGFWNSNALVANGANKISADGRDFEPHRTSGVRILYGVREQIRENVSQHRTLGDSLFKRRVELADFAFCIPGILRRGALRSTICWGRNLGWHAVRASAPGNRQALPPVKRLEIHNDPADPAARGDPHSTRRLQDQ
jgi:hypothetical protein